MMKKTIFYSLLFLITLACANIAGCHSRGEKQHEATILTIAPKTHHNTLYFSGIFQPIEQTPVLSPTDGTIEKIYFSYGQQIQTNQPLLTIISTKQQTDFQAAFTNYLKTKQSYLDAKTKFKETSKLYKEEIVSRDEYTENKSNFYLAKLSYLQAQSVLQGFSQYPQMKNINAPSRTTRSSRQPRSSQQSLSSPDLIGGSKNLLSLSINDINTVNAILASSKKATNLQITAPISGVALFPMKNNSDQSKITAGATVKKGQTLLFLGDTNGLLIHIQVGESNFNQIKVGETATITCDAAPQFKLMGKVTNVDTQASENNNSPLFAVTIEISKMTPEAKKAIRVGMSAKVAIDISHQHQIAIPIEAVFQKNNQSTVTILDSKTGAKNDVKVTTGNTTLNDVMITSGLKAGDKVVIPTKGGIHKTRDQ